MREAKPLLVVVAEELRKLNGIEDVERLENTITDYD